MSLLRTLLCISAAAGLLLAAELKNNTASFATHEWGTFTSVADESGSAVSWAPLVGPGDLPCFVTQSGTVHKNAMRGLVRMETPVLYFYANQPQTISVHVEFPDGLISEWYPDFHRPEPNQFWSGGSIVEWRQVRLLPGPDLNYPKTEGASRYYAARNTDATPLRVDDEPEKMIFYRGLGDFTPPLQAHYVEPGSLQIRKAQPIPFVIAFENQHGAVGFRIAENVTGTVTMRAPELTQDLAQLQSDLVRRLTGLGLYPKEAAAMVDTWSDSWFSEGSRVLYIVPRSKVDALLPLTITPSPASLARVFVGRIDLLSPRTEATLKRAVRSGDSETLNQFGRFLEPFVTQIQRTDKSFMLSPAAQTYLRAISTGHTVTSDGYGSVAPGPAPAQCIE